MTAMDHETASAVEYESVQESYYDSDEFYSNTGEASNSLDKPSGSNGDTSRGENGSYATENAIDISHGGQSLTAINFSLSPSLTASPASSFNISPFEWYDLIAQDAISNIRRLDNTQGHKHLKPFDGILLRAQSRAPDGQSDSRDQTSPNPGKPTPATSFLDDDAAARLLGNLSASKPWNTVSDIELSAEDISLLRYYTNVIGPILDLFDPAQHFTKIVPHLGMRNIGLLKSILAVAARHLSLPANHSIAGDGVPHAVESNSACSPATIGSGGALELGESPAHVATQYYYETLHYLSQTLLYPSYAESDEILATAILIGTYEMLDAEGASGGGNWERHLRGAFWIQRSQDNDGESIDGLRRAVWWAWLRQDIWAAFRGKRPTLTIWKPKKRLDELDSDELATRILYICAKCVEFASHRSEGLDCNFQKRIEHGNRLLRALQDWYDALPLSYRRIVGSAMGELVPDTPSLGERWTSNADDGCKARFPSIWVHPPNHAGAIQIYHFARTIVLLTQPAAGGLYEYRQRQRSFSESLQVVCGIASACQEQEPAMAFVNVQAVFAGK